MGAQPAGELTAWRLGAGSAAGPEPRVRAGCEQGLGADQAMAGGEGKGVPVSLDLTSPATDSFIGRTFT